MRSLLGHTYVRGFETFDELVAAVDRKEVDYGVLPVENSIYGSIARSYDLLSAHRTVRVVDETTLRISQCLIGIAGADPSTITAAERYGAPFSTPISKTIPTTTRASSSSSGTAINAATPAKPAWR